MADEENLNEKIAAIAGINNAKSTVDRDVVNSRKIKPRLTGPERQRKIHESTIFWETYYKLKPKYEKKLDPKGKTKVKEEATMVGRVLKKSEEAKQKKDEKGSSGMGLFLGALLMKRFLPMLLAGFKLGVIAALAMAVVKLGKELWNKWETFSDEGKEFRETTDKRREWQHGPGAEEADKEIERRRAKGDEIGAQIRQIIKEGQKKIADLHAAQGQIRDSWAYKLSVTNPIDSNQQWLLEKGMEILGNKMEKVDQEVERKIQELKQHPDYIDPANRDTANAMNENNRLLRGMANNIAKLASGGTTGKFTGQAPPVPHAPRNQGTYNDQPAGTPLQYNESGRDSYISSPNNLTQALV